MKRGLCVIIPMGGWIWNISFSFLFFFFFFFFFSLRSAGNAMTPKIFTSRKNFDYHKLEQSWKFVPSFGNINSGSFFEWKYWDKIYSWSNIFENDDFTCARVFKRIYLNIVFKVIIEDAYCKSSLIISLQYFKF